MKLRHYLVLAGVLFLAGGIPGNHPSPLPDTIVTPNISYNVMFTNNNPPPAADTNYFPTVQGQNVANALDNTNAAAPGAPNGYHAGYTGMGFLAPTFGGTNNVFIFDCGMHGGCDTANAPADRINMPTSFYASQTEPCLRVVVGHELFHHVQYSYITFAKWSIWGGVPVEGTARLMQDKVYNDLDAAGGCITYLSEVNNYLGNPNQTMWNISYTSAIFWNYLMEQLGTVNAEPQIGVDFIVAFWQNAQTNNATPDTVGTIRQTITQFNGGETLENMFHDFSICNYAKDLNVGAIPNSARYQYRDENDGNGQTYNQVALTWTGAVPPTKGPTASSVVSWGARYFVAQPAASCKIVGFKSTGDVAAYGLVAIKGTDTATRLHKSVTGDFARAFMNRAADPYTKLAVSVAGLTDPANFTYTFACSSNASVEIVRPNTTFKAYAGEPAAPERFLVILNVLGPPELGTPSVEGLDMSDFTVYVGAEDPANQADILSGAYVQGSYWLVVQAPVKAMDGTYPLLVKLGDLGENTKDGVVLYEKLIRDQVVVVDASGSMDSPAGTTKLEAAKNAGRLFVDASAEDDQLGVVWFSGDGIEPNDDATTVHTLQGVAGQRTNAKNQITNLTPQNLTAIGDGLQKGQSELNAHGKATSQHVLVLLSDGLENEAAFWSAVEAAITGAGTVVHTIALGPEADQALMQEIATETGGDYLYVDLSGAGPAAGFSLAGMSLPNRLADSYRMVNETIRSHQRLWEQAGILKEGQRLKLEIPVEEKDLLEPVFSFNWASPSSKTTVDLVRPDGTPVLAGQPGVQVLQDPTHVAFHLGKAEPGVWSATLSASTGAEYFASLSAKNRTGVQLQCYLGQRNSNRLAASLKRYFLRGVPMPILASLTDRKGGVRGAKVTAEVQHPDGGVDLLDLFDDGNHGDGNAHDGIYANVYTRTTVGSTFGVDDRQKETPGTRGSYLVRITATGKSSAGERFERHKLCSFHLFEFDPKLRPTEDPDVDQDGLPDRWELSFPCLSVTALDSRGDPDQDGLTNNDEYRLGTNPCKADTDGGGESDLSEVNRGANPLDPTDDGVRCPIDVEVLSWSPDHLLDLPLKPNTNLIRYPVSPDYVSIQVLRSTEPRGPFKLAVEFDAQKFEGLFPDRDLENKVTYYYQLVAVGRNGARSCPSRIFSGTPKLDPFPPRGSVMINDNRPFTGSTRVTLRLDAEKDATEMLISNHSAFDDAKWQSFGSSLPWVIEPDKVTGYAIVFAKFRDQEQNESSVYMDEITFRPAAELGAIRGTARLEGAADHSGTLALAPLSPAVLPVVTDAQGGFALPDLPPATYLLEFSHPGYQTLKSGKVEVAAGRTATIEVQLTKGGAVEQFHRGDANNDGTNDISDGLSILTFLFLGGQRPTCLETMDVNNDAALDISDGAFILSFLFLGGAEPPPPGPTDDPCGPDPDAPGSPGDLGCESYPACR